MKKLKMILISLLTVGMLLSSTVVNVTAAEQEYTYTVTLYAGKQGIFLNGEDKIVKTGLRTGDIVEFDISSGGLELIDSGKYYIKGIRQSGRDNNDAVENPRINVDGDKDFVVAYGIKGDMVSYTVNYRDEEGNELLPSSINYGNVGDKPVVAYQYIENYTPMVKAFTKTLLSDESKNVFNFIYTPVTTETIPVPGETTTVTTVIPGTTTTETTVIETPAAGTTGTTGTEGAGTPGEAGTPGTEGTAEGTGTPEAGADQGTQVIEPEEVPEGNQDIVDLDEEETPLADNPEETKEKVKKGLPLAAGIAIGVGAVAALSALAVFLIRRRR
ncbi:MULTISPECIES: MucBP domain-containing protein [Blautia]|uniref:MucBP domain-containing protein n=1 Tax=Blautia TaxID=572511 RepID=UPI000BA37B83|nr:MULTISPECIES: MucBP domain-containing protein [Blautia]